MPKTPLSEARRQAEEALQNWRDSPLTGMAHVPQATWDDAARLYNALRVLLAATARETGMSPETPLDHVAFLTGLPVELNSLLPEGSIFMHPRTFSGLPAEHPSWLDRMRAEAKKVTGALDGDGRDGFNGSGPFEE